MSTWYRTDNRRYRIDPVEVVKSSMLFVTLVDGARVVKVGVYWSYFPEWEEAKQYLFDKANRDVLSARLSLERANGVLGNIKGLKPPATEKACPTQ